MHTIQTPRIYVLVLVVLLPILVTNIIAADVSPLPSSSSSFITEKKDTNSQHTDGTQNKIISLPLIHRDQVIARRRRELRAKNKKTRLMQQQEQNNITASEGEPETDNSQEEYSANSEKDTNESAEEEIEDGDLVEDDEDFPPGVIGQLFQGMGTHFVDLWVGTPTPQRQTLIVDTGSGVVAFPCEPCRDCGKSYHTDGDFRHQESTTYILEQCDNCNLGTCKKVDDFDYCGMSMGYAEGSTWHAYESRDYVYVGGSHSEPEILDADHNATRRYTRGNIERRDFVREGSASITKSTLSKIEKHAASLRKTTYQQDAKELEAAFKKEASELQATYEENHDTSHYAPAKDFSFELNFGCQYKITGLFKTQLADGMMGMENSASSLWRQMHAAGMIASKRFALCFTHSQSYVKEGTPAGTMTLGGVDKTMHSSPMVFAEHIPLNDWFSVHIQNMYLQHPKNKEEEGLEDGSSSGNETGGLLYRNDHRVLKMDVKSKDLNAGGIIVDSGTTESYLPAAVRLPFTNAFQELMGFEFKPQVTKNGTDYDIMDVYPTILIQLKAAMIVADDELMDESSNPIAGLAGTLDLDNPNDVILEIPPDQYMMWSGKSKAYKNRFHMDDASQFGVLGANSMYRHDILFDMDKNRIGIAKSDCILPK